jgi:hypothetical protein
MVEDDYIQSKELILNTLINDTDKNKKYLEFFGLGEENFSKSLRSQLDKFVKEIKNNQDLFTFLEKENLIFVNSKFSDDENIDSSICKLELKKLESIRHLIKNLNLKLKIEKEKLNTANINRRNKLITGETNKNSPSNNETFNKLNLDFVVNKLQALVDKNSKNKNYNKNNFDELSQGNNLDSVIIDSESSLNKISDLKNKILTLNEKNKILKNQKIDYENKIKKFCNLPSDINKIKEMINLKKEEYLNLK